MSVDTALASATKHNNAEVHQSLTNTLLLSIGCATLLCRTLLLCTSDTSKPQCFDKLQQQQHMQQCIAITESLFSHSIDTLLA
jgi:hypothetical protein